MQQEFGFVPKAERQLSLPFLKRAADLDAEQWAQRRAEDQAENQRTYRR
jgi:hypothetical protein